MKEARLFLDVSPLRDYAWTGIPAVTAKIARYLLDTRPEATVFYYGPDVVLPQFVSIAIDHAPGGYLRAFIESGTAIAGSLDGALRGDFVSVGLFPNIKPVHRVFDIELVIIHDISAILMPEMHTLEAAVEHSQAHMRDVASSDLICCVSEATRQDVIQYLQAPAERVFVSHLGSDPVEEDTRELQSSEPVPPYVVILGTIEPRKNLGLIADFIRCRPEICDQIAFFFVGRRGWGVQFEELFGDIMHMSKCRDRVFFTDYVTEKLKRSLLRHARFAIYPSFFEGFGLPVVESMAAGCPTIASRSSSLVELGLDDAAYFDPLSLSDFSRAFGQMQAMTMRDEERRRLSRDFVRRASVFSWETFVKRIMDRVEEAVGSLSGARPSGPITVRQRGRRRTIEGAAKMESSQCERAIR
jgi:glycosyltransferase involved in cell wall biosynthesis